VFRRRNPLPFLQWLQGLLWPRTGWRRAFAYYLKRLTRLTGTPHNIAAGVACGVGISFTPFVGLHIVIGALLALIVRGNLLAVVVGTLAGNPWTFPFMWVASYEVGHYLLGSVHGGGQPAPWAFADVAGYVADAVREAASLGLWPAAKNLAADLRVVAWPMIVGSLPLGLTTGLAVYFPLARAIGFYQLARLKRREKRALRNRASDRLKATAAPNDLVAR
jgi:uncharacterized protein (DUF2062 family)